MNAAGRVSSRLALFSLVLLLAAASNAFAAKPAPPAPATLEVPVGPATGKAPTKEEPFEMKLSVVDKKGHPVIRTVKIPSDPPDPNQPEIPIWKPSAKRDNETFQEWNARMRDERAEASRKKAEAIKYAIDKTFKDVYDKLPERPAVGNEAVNDKYGPAINGNLRRDQLWGLITIPRVDQKVNPKTGMKEGVMWGKNPMGEGTDNSRFQPTSPGSMGANAKMALTPSSASNATGIDLGGDPSFVQFGVQELYVATLYPTPGMNDLDILMGLNSLLNSNGMPATYDPFNYTLSLDDLILPGQTLAWGNTDPGLDFMVSFQGSYVVPEPATWLLSAIGACASSLLARRRPRVR